MFPRSLSFSEISRNLYRAIQLLWKADKPLALINLGLQVLMAILPIGSLFLIKLTIEALTSGASTYNDNLILIFAFIGVQFVFALVNQYSNYINVLHQQKITDYLSGQVLEKAVKIDYDFYENASFHDTLHLAQQQAVYKAAELISAFNAVLMNGFSLLFLMGLFLSIHSFYALLFIIFLLPLAIIKWYYGLASHIQMRKLTPIEREADYLHHILTGVSFAKEVRVFGFSDFFIQKFNKLRQYILQEKRKLNLKLTRYSILAECLEIIAIAFVFILLSKQTWEKTISIGAFIIFLQGFQRLQSNSKSFLNSLVQLLQLRIFLQDLFLFFDIETQKKPLKNIVNHTRTEGLAVENVSFHYPNSTAKVLQNISLKGKPGQVIAIVGENGSGKSTLVKLLANLYALQEGVISLDGQAISAMNAAEYQEKCVFLFQDFEKYFFTIEENIALGIEQSAIDPDKLEQAVAYSGAKNFIEKLSQQYQTRMGSIFQGSEQLSGGQWQKLALSRIFYKNARMLVLDEPTSAIDPTAELQIFKQLKENVKDKVVVLITHRLYNLKIADHIYVLENGRIAEDGSFSDLLNHGGLFKSMFDAQSV